MGGSASLASAENQRLKLIVAHLHGIADHATFFDKYRLGSKLGSGRFGQVRALTCKHLAVKILDLRRRHGGCFVQDAHAVHAALQEADSWVAADYHDNIVLLRDAFLQDDVCFFIMDRCDMSFKQFLTTSEMTDRKLAWIFSDMLAGLSHLHRRLIVHRDVKPGNVVVNQETCKLCDFGLARILPDGNEGLSGVCGTSPFIAPEMLQQKLYKTESDVWSMGVMLYVLCFGSLPYAGKGDVLMEQSICDGKQLPSFRSVGLPSVCIHAQSLARNLLNRNPGQRMTAGQALEHPLFQGKAPTQPCLQPIVHSALKCGAFERGLCDVHEDLDVLLGKLHEKQAFEPDPAEVNLFISHIALEDVTV